MLAVRAHIVAATMTICSSSAYFRECSKQSSLASHALLVGMTSSSSTDYRSSAD